MESPYIFRLSHGGGKVGAGGGTAAPEAHGQAADLTSGNYILADGAAQLMARMTDLRLSVGWIAGVRKKAAALLGLLLTRGLSSKPSMSERRWPVELAQDLGLLSRVPEQAFLTDRPHAQAAAGIGTGMDGTNVATETCGQVRVLKFRKTVCVY